MSFVDLILKKRDGHPLTNGEIADFVTAVKEKTVADYQISAMLMAIFFRGMNSEEIATFTREMALSGESLSFPSIKEPIVDKHSSGGVGDKTSLVISPIVAACGLPVAKLSGRGLGFTGGTIDKLESIPGFRTELSSEEFTRFVEKDGIAIMGQSAKIAPVDKILYALRDVTGTVDSIPLIAGSIMSKKLADGSDAIVLDVKYGSGAFMKTTNRAVELAKVMVGIGEDNGKSTLALVTNMDQPLGCAVGNNLEVIEAVEALHGRGPEDFLLECRAIASAMLELGGKAASPEEAGKKVQEVIKSGAAFDKFLAMVENQGGNVEYINNPSHFSQADLILDGQADREGFVASINTEEIGKSSLLLGAGRARLDDPIDPAVGIKVFKKIGDEVRKGDLLFTVHANDRMKGEEAVKKAFSAYNISENPVDRVNHPVFCRVKREGRDYVEERMS